MIAVNLIGGLGNQMFQYAFGFAIAHDKGIGLKLDISGFENYPLRRYGLDCFSLSPNFLTESDKNFFKLKPRSLFEKVFFHKRSNSANFYEEQHFHYDKRASLAPDNTYYKGYWQSELYFSNWRSSLLLEFQLRNPISSLALSYLKRIQSTYSVSLHIRRGDYLFDKKTNSVHWVCDLDYYRRAIQLLLSFYPYSTFVVFSDDILWCKRNLNFLKDPLFVEINRSASDYEELYLMSICKHNIIANSTFSWWGAWLNQNPEKKVIAPNKWFNDELIDTSDLIPKSWIRK